MWPLDGISTEIGDKQPSSPPDHPLTTFISSQKTSRLHTAFKGIQFHFFFFGEKNLGSGLTFKAKACHRPP